MDNDVIKRKRDNNESDHVVTRIVIIGAGCLGLSAARYLAIKNMKEDHKIFEITLVATSFLSQTTSFGSAGYWMPYEISGTSPSKINEWGADSYKYFLSLLNSKDASKVGIQMMESYQLYENDYDVKDPAWKDVVMNYRRLGNKDVKQLLLPCDKYKVGFAFTTLVVDQKYYLKYMTDELIDYGVKFEQRNVRNLNELSDYDVVINCCGLNGDIISQSENTNTTNNNNENEFINESFPIRGQVIRVKAPWIRNVWGFGTSYVIPNMDNVVLGGTAQKGDHNTTCSLADSENIMSNICQLFPSLRDAPLVSYYKFWLWSSFY